MVAALLGLGPGDDDDDDYEGVGGGGSGGNIDPDDDEGYDDDDDDDEDEEPLQVVSRPSDAKPCGRGAGCRASYPRRPPTRTAPTRRNEALAARTRLAAPQQIVVQSKSCGDLRISTMARRSG